MTAALAVLGGPLLAFAAIALVPPLRRSGRTAALVSLAGIGVALAASAVLAAPFLAGTGAPRVAETMWAPIAGAPGIRFGLAVDGLAASMALLVALIAGLVQLYSLAYMKHESRPALGRYYAYHALFAFAMLGLVLSHNLLQTYVFWELVGLGSYLLIGFYWEKPAAGRAAQKAFWTTRLGDAGFALGILVLWGAGGTLTFTDLFARAEAGTLAGPALTLGVLGIYLGAMGKSAQFPLHVWLPDAMEGPTPVSALLHAATMVAAGVYLMVRIAPLLAHAPAVATLVLAIGVLTSLMAGSMALVERDIKRVLAHSTVSQLGMMMAAVGCGAAGAAYFHLVTHAFFKALLFLAAGSVIHAVHTNDLFAMGGLARRMPWTSAALGIGALALAGIVPTAGFFSKDEILAAVLASGHPVAFALLLAGAGMTGFYAARAVLLAVGGSADRAPRGAHESPALMTAPLAVLGVLALGGGALASSIPRLLAASIAPAAAVEPHGSLLVAVAGTLAASAGIVLAWLAYGRRSLDAARLRAAAGPLATLIERRYYVDTLFDAGLRLGVLGASRVVAWVDRYLVDGVVNALAWGTWSLAGRLRRLQSGRVQDALYAVAVGLVLLVWLALAR